jgi:hypothetical protein
MTQIEHNAENPVCEWSFLNGQKGTDTCHIVSQGTAQGEKFQVIKIGEQNKVYYVNLSGTWSMDEIVNGNDTEIATGTIMSNNYTKICETNSIQVLKLSNGLTIKLYHIPDKKI